MSNRYSGRIDVAEIRLKTEQTESEKAVRSKLIDEAREIRMKELERRHKEEDNEHDSSGKHESTSKTRVSNDVSRRRNHRSSVDHNHSAVGNCHNLDHKDLRSELAKLNEKFKGVMVTNAQLDNEKKILRYEVDLLKDKLEDLVDTNASLQKSFLEKKRECSYQRLQITELSNRIKFVTEQLEARDRLLAEHDLVLLGGLDLPPASDRVPGSKASTSPASLDVDEPPRSSGRRSLHPSNGESRGAVPQVNGETVGAAAVPPSMAIISKRLADQLNALPEEKKLEAQIDYLFNSRNELTARITKLEAQLEEERRGGDSGNPRLSSIRGHRNSDPIQVELKQDLLAARSQAQELKYKLQEEIQKKHALETDIIRLEGQIKRYKNIAESCEQQEIELRTQQRQRQRESAEARELTYLVEDLKLENNNLKRKLEKFGRGSLAPSSGLAPSSADSRRVRESSMQR